MVLPCSPRSALTEEEASEQPPLAPHQQLLVLQLVAEVVVADRLLGLPRPVS